MNTRKITLVSMFTCLIALSAFITVPSTVPFTLQTFMIFCAVKLLGGKLSLFSVVLYILCGTVGLPVFSGFGGGIGHLLSPTGGFIIGFVFIPIIYWIFEKRVSEKVFLSNLVLTAGLMVCYISGAVWFYQVAMKSGNPKGFFSIISICILPYIIPDLLKLFLAEIISKKVRALIKI